MSRQVYSYRDLDVWQKAMDLVTRIYQMSAGFPKEEMYGLTSQLRHVAVSIPSNIAEGKSRRATKEYIRFLNIAYGSVADVETQLQIACNLAYIIQKDAQAFFAGYSEVSKMLSGLIARLERGQSTPESRILNPDPYTENA